MGKPWGGTSAAALRSCVFLLPPGPPASLGQVRPEARGIAPKINAGARARPDARARISQLVAVAAAHDKSRTPAGAVRCAHARRTVDSGRGWLSTVYCLYCRRMVIVGCFDLHIARHIPPSAVKLPLCHCGRLVGAARGTALYRLVWVGYPPDMVWYEPANHVGAGLVREYEAQAEAEAAASEEEAREEAELEAMEAEEAAAAGAGASA
eukprot:scaffold10020_cov122-Isochrysis_galbana.AAC.14